MWGFTRTFRSIDLSRIVNILMLFPQDSEMEIQSNEPPSVSGNSKDISSDTHQSSNSQSVSSLSIAEAQRCLSLYFALCTKVFLYFILLSKTKFLDVHFNIKVFNIFFY